MSGGQHLGSRRTPRVTGFLFLVLLAFLFAAADAAAQAGVFDHVAGNVFVQPAGGDLRRAENGASVANGDTVTTEPGAYANIRFTDGGQVFLRPNTRVIIDAYAFEKDRVDRDSFVYRLLKGSLRAITGQIGSRGKPEAYRLNTVIATIGIRGTTFNAELCAGDCPGKSDGLRTDAVDKAHNVSNPAGSAAVEPKEGSYTRDAQTPPEVVKGGNGLGQGDPPLSPTARSRQQEEKTETIEETQANIARSEKEQAGTSQRNDERLEKLERENQPQRSAYQGKVEAFAQGTKPPPGISASPPSYDADGGRYTSATITYTDGAGKITHAAHFDADGNTKGIEQTPLGKILQTISPVLQKLAQETGRSSLDRDFDDGLGGDFISSVTIYDGNGVLRAVYRFNEGGVPYSSLTLGPDGKTIVSAGEDPSAAPVVKDPGGPLAMVQPQRFVTGVCAPCQSLANRINNLADEMNGLMEPINARARSHGVASVSGQLGTRAEHADYMARWNGYKAEYDNLLNRLGKECRQPCTQPQQTTSLIGQPVAMCTIETASAAAAEATAKGANAALGLVTKLPAGGVEAEVRVPTSSDPKAAESACGSLNPGPGGRLIEKVPCGEMAQPVTPYARSVGRNPIEAKVAAGADFSQTTVVSGGANPGSPQGFVNNARPGWGADAAGGPSVQRGPTGGSFQLPTLPGGSRQPSLTESLNVGSLSTVDFDRVQKGVKTGQAALTFATKIEELKYKLDNGLPIKPEEVLSLSKEINALRGSRFKKLGPLLDGITKGLEQKKELAQNLATAQQILDFLNTADRGRDDPVAAAEALSKYLNLVSSVAGKVPGMGEFVTMYAQGVEGMLDGLRVMQKRHDLTVETMRDINDFTKDFYGELEQPPTAADTPAAPPRDPKAEADAENIYRGTRAEAGRLQDATSTLRSTERCIDNCLAQLGALQNRLRDLDDNQRRMGNEAGLRARAQDMASDKQWYDDYVAKNGKAATPTNRADFDRWSRGRNITDRQVVEARERIGSFRALDAERARIRAEMDKLAQRLAECEKRQVGEQREYLQALRAYVEKTTFLEELAATGDAARAQIKATAARDRIPIEPPPVRYRVAPETRAQVALAPARIVTVCEDTRIGGPVTPTISVPYDPSAVGRTRTR